ncbi:hypothetical protein [Gephyromycinifex aptenodytis]|uniref:hypothetical protein n=1 Tax=Gephyromycinifex aptenodytis TaxID=2716227 RepID=UPI00144530EC|nr:hypothetical protein [Gephyromycinifex aptenodytis]
MSRAIFGSAPDGLAVLGLTIQQPSPLGDSVLEHLCGRGFTSGRDEDQVDLPDASGTVELSLCPQALVITRLAPLGPVPWITLGEGAPADWRQTALGDRNVLLLIAPHDAQLSSCDVEAVEALLDRVIRGLAAACLVPVVDGISWSGAVR